MCLAFDGAIAQEFTPSQGNVSYQRTSENDENGRAGDELSLEHVHSIPRHDEQGKLTEISSSVVGWKS